MCPCSEEENKETSFIVAWTAHNCRQGWPCHLPYTVNWLSEDTGGTQELTKALSQTLEDSQREREPTNLNQTLPPATPPHFNQNAPPVAPAPKPTYADVVTTCPAAPGGYTTSSDEPPTEARRSQSTGQPSNNEQLRHQGHNVITNLQCGMEIITY